jgi:hypothetical protein
MTSSNWDTSPEIWLRFGITPRDTLFRPDSFSLTTRSSAGQDTEYVGGGEKE